MATNYPGPYELEINYTVTGQVHKHRLNVDIDGTPAVGTALGSIALKTRGGGTINAVAAVDAWIDLIKVLFHTSVAFGEVKLWKYTPFSYEKQFFTSYTSTAVGTSTDGQVLAHQRIFTFRTLEGGTMKIVLLETSSSDQQQYVYSQLGATLQAIADYVMSPTTWMLARDTSCPIAMMTLSSGENEKLWRKRYRS